MAKPSGLFFIAAKEAAKRAHVTKGTPEEQNEAMIAVVLSIIVLEAGINEICDWHNFHHLRPPYKIHHEMPVFVPDASAPALI